MFLLQALQDKAVNRIARPAPKAFGVFHSWNSWTHRRLESPMVARVFGASHGSLGPVRALVNPGAEQTDLFTGERVALLGHAGQVLFASGHGLDEEALRAVARHEEGSGVAAFEGSGFLIEAEAGLLFFRAVTFVTSVGQDRLDVFGEINFADGGCRRFARVSGSDRSRIPAAVDAKRGDERRETKMADERFQDALHR